MARSNKNVALVALFAALGGCNANSGGVASASDNRSLNSVNQPVVQRTDYVLDLTGSDAGLTTTERARLRSWFESLGLGYGDRVWVDQAYQTPSRNDVARVAAEFGILLSDGAPVTPGTIAPGSVRVIVARSTASVPGCPNWASGGPSSTSAGYGCATNSNLAAMIADPSDLVLGQTGTGNGDGATAAKAIRVHRETAPTATRGLETMSSKGGK